jgi:hypothetical protein
VRHDLEDLVTRPMVNGLGWCRARRTFLCTPAPSCHRTPALAPPVTSRINTRHTPQRREREEEERRTGYCYSRQQPKDWWVWGKKNGFNLINNLTARYWFAVLRRHRWLTVPVVLKVLPSTPNTLVFSRPPCHPPSFSIT